MPWFFLFFFVSGFCGILYELVWLRLAMAQFAVTTAFISIVLSVFMAGLGFGSWGGGRYVESRRAQAGGLGLRLYAMAELMIGFGALLVPHELAWGRALLEKLAGSVALPAGLYYLASGVWIALALGPFCAAMGATFPFTMFAIRERFPGRSEQSFSFLYLANISGAVLGSAVPLLMIEVWGFHGALRVGMVLNAALGAAAFMLSNRKLEPETEAAPEDAPVSPKSPPGSGRLLWLVFATGLTTMGVEVVWVRLYTSYLGTVVYAFAAILGIYLAATYVGSKLYRMRRSVRGLSGLWLAFLGLSALLPLTACDPRRSFWTVARVIVGIVPFSAAAGFLTPMLMDRYSQGDPARAGRGYAVNIAGCVLGPLLAGFVLLPLGGERLALLVLALPWLVLGLAWRAPAKAAPPAGPARILRDWGWRAFAVVATVALAFFTRSYEWQFRPIQILRDHTATVVATGDDREDKKLLVNGVGMTTLTPITKFMAHLPLASLVRRPENALVICFGMGTTHRSMLSWGIHSTAVELAPSVPRFFSYFHEDAPALLASPLSRVVIDDGRFFLERTSQQFDVIVIDPPPPVEAAASSLLYSKELYRAAKPRLKPGGILAQWLPAGDDVVQAAAARAIKESFPFVRVFRSVEGWGYHFLASETLLPRFSAADLAGHLPPAAAEDLVEWGPAATPAEQFAIVLKQELTLDSLIQKAPSVEALRDDRPVNEYYLLRRMTQ
jgi:predicted membrane-bound spermidine synthase